MKSDRFFHRRGILSALFWCFSNKTVYNTGSCFGFRVPVVCNASLFCVMRRRITQHVRGRGWAHYRKSGALQKKVTHYKKLVPETRNLVPETRNKNQCYCRPLLEQGRLQNILKYFLLFASVMGKCTIVSMP